MSKPKASGRGISTDPAIVQKVQQLCQSGWTLQRGSKHWRVKSPSGRTTLTIPGTPSDKRAALNWISQIRRVMRTNKESAA